MSATTANPTTTIIDFFTAHGRIPDRKAGCAKEEALLSVIKLARKAERSGKVSAMYADRIAAWDEAGVPWRGLYARTDGLDDAAVQIAQHFRDHGAWPSQYADSPDERRLYALLKAARDAHRAGSSSPTAAKRIAYWEAESLPWNNVKTAPAGPDEDTYLTQVIAFHAEHGHLPRPHATDAAEARLGGIVSHVREAATSGRHTPRTGWRADALDAAGLAWRDTPGTGGYTSGDDPAAVEIAAFYRAHRRWPRWQGSGDNETRLAAILHAARTKGADSPTAAKRIAYWESENLPWNTTRATHARNGLDSGAVADAVIAFYRRHGRLPRYRQDDPREGRLGAAINAARAAHKNGTLTGIHAERVDAWNDARIPWKATRRP